METSRTVFTKSSQLLWKIVFFENANKKTDYTEKTEFLTIAV